MDKLKAKVLIGMDILGPEQAVIDIERQILTLPMCQNLTTKLTVTLKHQRTSRIVLAEKLFTVPANSITAVPIQLKGSSQLPRERDFIFQPVRQKLNLGTRGGPRAHIVDSNFSFVEVQNATNHPVIIPCKARLGCVLDYEEEGCYAINAEEAHLAAGAKWPSSQRLVSTSEYQEPPSSRISAATSEFQEPPDMIEKHLIGFTTYGTKQVRDKLFSVAAQHQVWSKTGGFIKILEDEWMPITLKPGARPTGAKVYQLGPADEKLIDETFDFLYKEGKMEWSNNPTQYKAPVFVIWRTLPSREQKGQVVTDNRELNKMVVADMYPMPLQTRVIALVAESCYITVVDTAAFFYQFRVTIRDRQKLTVISHRGQEYFNVAPMGYCGLAAYAQRRINIILRGHEAYAKAYIDDIVIFSATLEQHLSHLDAVFRLFVEHNVALNPQKAYIGYPSITLLGQKMNGLGLISAAEKIAAISNWKFSRNLKLLESYLGFTN